MFLGQFSWAKGCVYLNCNVVFLDQMGFVAKYGIFGAILAFLAAIWGTIRPFFH
jgi:hypothetical protein